jgi:muramoyltetrapeptide carboxypeptidase
VQIGIVAPSSRVPQIELKLGVELLKQEGFEIQVHKQCARHHRYLAGTDEERAQAFVDYALDPSIDVIWCARGGYGAGRLLPLFKKLAQGKQIPRNKLLVGYSDATAIFEFVKNEWGWSVLHASMPGLRSFFKLTPAEWKSLVALIQKTPQSSPWGKLKLKKISGSANAITGELAGGNLTVWGSLVGTPYFTKGAGKILFFEDVSEFPYRLDRVLNQLDLAGGFEGAKAIVLGDFLDCKDSVPLALKKMPKKGLKDPSLKNPKPRDLEPLRKAVNERKIVAELFQEIGEKHGIPIFSGFPAGHGPGHFSLPIGAIYTIAADGAFQLSKWSWS